MTCVDSGSAAGDDGGKRLGLTRTGVSSSSSIMAVDFIFLFFLRGSVGATEGGLEGRSGALVEPSKVADSWDEFGARRAVSIGATGDDGGRCFRGLTRTGVSSASSTVTVDFLFLCFLCETVDATRGGSEGLMEPAGVVDNWDEFGVTYVGSGGAVGDDGG